MAKLLDANAILRFLLNDIPEQAQKTSAVIYDGAFTIEAVLSEVVYVLGGVYNRSRNDISKSLSDLLDLISITNKNVVKYSLEIFAKTSLDFVDCLLISYNNLNGTEIFSFDKKLNKKLLQQ